jgi:hypothetical protein
MFGVMTRHEEELEWSEFDRRFYEVKDVSGRASEPVENAVNAISCFADNATARADPEVLSMNDAGEEATRERPYFDWSHVCPTHPDYREGLLATIETTAAANGDVRLDDVGFARAEYCFCDRCTRQFEDSAFDDRFAWRASVITEFVADASERIPGRTYLTVHPDPYPGHLYERSGIDVEALDRYVDEFVVPLYDTAYGTTYWLEVIASGFVDLFETPFSIELYAADIEIDELIHAAEVADAYAKDVLFGYDASTARAALRRMDADAREGATYGT